MPRIAQLFFKAAVVFLMIGIAIGMHMGISQDHSASPAHGHMNLLGWVSSAIFGGYYALNPAKAAWRAAMAHYVVFVVGLVVMLPALYLKYTGYPEYEPVLAAGSMIAAVGVLIFAYVVFTSDGQRVGA